MRSCLGYAKIRWMGDNEQAVGGEPKLIRVARKVVWWKPPEEALAYPERFIAQVMVWGNWEDVQVTRHHFGSEIFVSVLDTPPPGVFDQASWVYWNNVYGRRPTPPLPRRFG